MLDKEMFRNTNYLLSNPFFKHLVFAMINERSTWAKKLVRNFRSEKNPLLSQNQD